MTKEVSGDYTQAVLAKPTPTQSLSTMTRLMVHQGLQDHAAKMDAQLGELDAAHARIKELHRLQQLLQAAPNEPLSITPEIEGLFTKAKECGVSIPECKDGRLASDGRIRLADHLRTTIDDLSIDTKMKLNAVSRVTDTLHEIQAAARQIIRTLHETIKTLARKIHDR